MRPRCSSSLPLPNRASVDLSSFPNINSKWGSYANTEFQGGRRTRDTSEKSVGDSTNRKVVSCECRRRIAGGNIERDTMCVLWVCWSTFLTSTSQMGLSSTSTSSASSHTTRTVPTAENFLVRTDGSHIKSTRRMVDCSKCLNPAIPVV